MNGTQQAPEKSHKVFITGGTGFLGAYITRMLVENGQPVRVMRRSSKLPFFIPSNILEKVEWVQGDVLDTIALDEAMDGIDHVVHCAAMASYAPHDRKRMF